MHAVADSTQKVSSLLRVSEWGAVAVSPPSLPRLISHQVSPRALSGLGWPCPALLQFSGQSSASSQQFHEHLLDRICSPSCLAPVTDPSGRNSPFFTRQGYLLPGTFIHKSSEKVIVPLHLWPSALASQQLTGTLFLNRLERSSSFKLFVTL